MANDRKGVMAGLREEEKKETFGTGSINNFRQKMLMEEKEENKTNI